MKDNFYLEFEECYYAPRDVIKTLRRQYVPFVQPLVELYRGAATFDVGCGRGEWLELMSELKFAPYGVDLDEGMLSACVELSLPAAMGDAVSFIATLPSNSQAIVTAFHVVEHITFDQLRTMVLEALRVLLPGGLLIMETPNPENLFVATQNFYIDPTHQRPIPSPLLAFVAKYTGFYRVKTLRLQEAKELSDKSEVTLTDVFRGVSPDYAVIAQKHADVDVLALFNGVFGRDFGLSQDELLLRWDRRFQLVEAQAQLAEAKAQKAEVRAEKAEAQAQQAEAKAQQAEALATQTLMEIEAIHGSASWRITAPLRCLMKFLKSFQRS